MAVRSLRHIPIFSWIPSIYDMEFKIEIVDSSGNTYNITDEIVEGEYTDGVTETIGNFTFTIDNTDEDYTGKFSLYDEIRIYMDYATSATTKVFTGLLEKVSTKGEDIVITGRSIASRVMGVTVTYAATDYTHEILSTILTNYVSYITKTNIDTTEATDNSITVNWYQKPFWECVQELCNRSGYDAYIDANSDFNYFVSGTRNNNTEAVVHDHNLEEVGDFTPDLSIVKNRIIVYGAKVEGMQIIWTAEDSNSINLYDVSEEIINDSSVVTTAQAQARADYELSIRKDPPIVGEITSLGLPTILPGERIKISDPDSNIQPNYYNIQKFTHKFSSDDVPLTILTIQKEINTIPKILKKRITFETQATDMENPNEMRYSWNFDFNTDSGVHTNTEITDSLLQLQTGQSSGNWISELNDVDANVTAFELRATGEDMSNASFAVSTDNGTNWQSISLNTAQNSTPPGENLKIKVTLSATTARLNSLCLLYKN